MKGDGVKRDVELKGVIQHAGMGQAVNHVTWARQTTGEQDCQNQVDVKALTGRGGLAALRQKVASLDDTVQKMATLSEKSKLVQGLGIYLVVHKRSSSGYVFLRWRQRLGTNRHLSWEDVDSLAQELPAQLRDWCIAASRQAQQLNDAHLEIRVDLKKTRKRLERAEPFMFPRSPFPL